MIHKEKRRDMEIEVELGHTFWTFGRGWQEETINQKSISVQSFFLTIQKKKRVKKILKEG